MFDFALSGITPYSRSVYFKFLEDYNLSLWPLQLLAAGIVILIVYRLISDRQNNEKVILFLLSLSWFISGWFYFLQAFTKLNWAGVYFAYGFIFQSLILLLISLFFKAGLITMKNTQWHQRLHGVLILVIILYPLTGFMDGRTIMQLELFALTPDVTVLFSLMFILLIQQKWKYLLMPVPLLWLSNSISSSVNLKLLQWQCLVVILCVWIVLVLSSRE